MAKLTKPMVNLINEQIQAELESAYLYLAMSNYYTEKGFPGFGTWFKKQAEEEEEHAEKFIDYLHGNDEKVVLMDIKASKEEYKDLRTPLASQYAHEQVVTSMIYKLMDLAIEEKDYRTQEMLRWFVSEQYEEEETARTLLEQYDLYGTDLAALMKLDHELGERK